MAFHLKNKKLHLTYKGHLKPEEWLDWANKNQKLPKIELYSIVNETSDKTNPYEHTHILICFEQNLDSRKPNIFDFEGIHPNIKKVSKKKHFENCAKYHYKQAKPYTNIELGVKDKHQAYKIKNLKIEIEDENELEEIDFGKLENKTTDPINFDVNEFIKNAGSGVKNNVDILRESHKKTVGDIHQYPTEGDAVRGIGNPKMAASVILSFKYKQTIYGPEPKVIWRPWQNQLLEEFETPSNGRSFKWIYDFVGKAGKSAFGEHLMKWHGAFLAVGADTKDLPTAMIRHRATGGNFKIIIIDLARTTKEDDDFYVSVEQMLNGHIMVKKYDSVMLDLGCRPHVVVFANRLPRKHYKAKVIEEKMDPDTLQFKIVEKNVLMETMSRDKWDIRRIDRVRNEITDKNEWLFTQREYNPFPDDDDELPEGYSRPGESKPVAEPDPIIETEDERKEEDTMFSSASRPNKSKIRDDRPKVIYEQEKPRSPTLESEMDEEDENVSHSGFSSISSPGRKSLNDSPPEPKKCFKSPPRQPQPRPSLLNLFPSVKRK